MARTTALAIFGNHRGGTGLVRWMPDATARQYDPGWLLADPKEDRASALASLVRQRFPYVRPTFRQLTAQETLTRQTGEEDAIVATMDSLGDTLETLRLRKARQSMHFQMVGRGPGGNGGVRLALQGTLLPGDEPTMARTELLFGTLEGMSRRGSSRGLTEADPLTAATLGPMRVLATRRTLAHLAEPERAPWDLSGGPLSVFFARQGYPLVPVAATAQERYSARKGLALDRAGLVAEQQLLDLGPAGRFLVVGLVDPAAMVVELFTVQVSPTGHRRVDSVVRLAPLPETAAAMQQPALFTD